MKSWIKRLLSPPVFEDADKTHTAQYLHYILLALFSLLIFILAVIAVTVATGTYEQLAFSLAIVFGIGILLIGMFYLNRRGRVRLASSIVLGVIGLGATLSASLFEGIYDSSLLIYFVLIVAAGLLLGRKAIPGVTLLLTLTSFFIAFADIVIFRRVTHPDYFAFRVAATTGMLFLLGMVFNLTIKRLDEAVTQARSELAERHRAEAAEHEQRLLAEGLLSTAIAMNSSLDFESLLDVIVDTLGTVIPHDASALAIIENESGQIVRFQGYRRFVVDTGPLVDLRIPLLEIADWIDLMPPGDLAPEASTQARDRWVSLVGGNWIRSHISAPIVVDGETVGFVAVDSGQPSFYTEQHSHLLSAFASQVSVALRNARLYRVLAKYNETLETAVETRTGELQRTTNRLETIVDSIAEGLVVMGREGDIQQINPAFTVMTYYQMADLVGREDRRFLMGMIEPEQTLADLTAALRNAAGWSGEVVIRNNDGSSFDAVLTVGPLRDGLGEAFGHVAIIRDISPIKEADRLKDRFLSIAAHELRTPLTSVLGFSEILLTREMGATRQKHFLEVVNQQAMVLKQILDDLLDIARLQAGRSVSIQPHVTSLSRIAQPVVEMYREISPSHRFVVSGFEAAPEVYCDPARISQVFQNLMSNAVKYSPEGGEVAIRCEAQPDRLRISVADHGLGISSEDREHLFEEFYRGEMVKSAIPGTGLGLRICKLIIEAHNGHLFVESVQGEGSTFTFTLPIVKVR